jgi:7-cyano-7-deazaguanine synthase in queuosine biosynthesis
MSTVTTATDLAADFDDAHDCFANEDGCGFCNECGAMLVRA